MARVVSLVTGVCREIGDTRGEVASGGGGSPISWMRPRHRRREVVTGLMGRDRAERAEDTEAGRAVARRLRRTGRRRPRLGRALPASLPAAGQDGRAAGTDLATAERVVQDAFAAVHSAWPGYGRGRARFLLRRWCHRSRGSAARPGPACVRVGLPARQRRSWSATSPTCRRTRSRRAVSEASAVRSAGVSPAADCPRPEDRCGLAWPNASRANPPTPTRRTMVRGDMNWGSGIDRPARRGTCRRPPGGARAPGRGPSRPAWAG